MNFARRHGISVNREPFGFGLSKLRKLFMESLPELRQLLMLVQLIVHSGPLAGTEAPIKPGYYLVGRHQECQIRPESRSVSRRHCLLLHSDDGFGVFDLHSSWGTFVNEERLEPHKWRHLHHGDVLRVARVSFHVCMCVEQRPAKAALADREIAEIAVNDPPSLRGNRARDSPSQVLTEHTDKKEVATAPTNNDEIENCPPEKSSRPERTPRAANEIRFRKPKQRRSLPRFSFPERIDWKLTLAILGIVAAASHFAFRLYRLQSSPEIEIRQGID